LTLRIRDFTIFVTNAEIVIYQQLFEIHDSLCRVCKAVSLYNYADIKN